MKKVLSIMMSVAMLVSCFAFSTNAMAVVIPSITVGGASVSVTLPKNGSDETSVKLAKFVPESTGWYEFECDALYTNTSSTEEIPGGVFAVDLYEEDYFATQGMCFFMDTSKLTDEQKAEYAAYGFNIDNMSRLITAALCKQGKTYYITGYQDGNQDYTANLTVKKHTHTIKTGQVEKVAVNKDGTSDEAGGIYDCCASDFCNYIKYTENYYQLEKTTVKNAVYTGKALKPAVIIKTTTGKKLASKYYTVTYKNNKKTGKGKAIIKFKNGYTGKVTKTFKIYPKRAVIKKVTGGDKQLKVNYKKCATVSGYKVQIALNKKFTKGKKTVTVKGAKKTSAVVKKLKNNKKYYVRVRAYKTVNGKKLLGKWSKVKSTTTKAPEKKTSSTKSGTATKAKTGYSDTVYITPTGVRYHFDPDCGGKNSYSVSYDSAVSMGYTPCQKCANG